MKHTTSRNNILHVREARNHSLSNHRSNIDNDYDYDLFNGQIPSDIESHGVPGEPVYVAGAGLNRATKQGRFELAPGSPGVGAGEWIRNFSPVPRGRQPDIGAHQHGAPPLQFGISAR